MWRKPFLSKERMVNTVYEVESQEDKTIQGCSLSLFGLKDSTTCHPSEHETIVSASDH